MSNPLQVFDCEMNADIDREVIEKYFREECEKYCFQREMGEKKGYIHYQCRMKFANKDKVRVTTLLNRMNKKFGIGNTMHLTPTSNENKDNFDYVSKERTRIEGPWSYKDKIPMYVPRQCRFDNPYHWQRYAQKYLMKGWNPRGLDLIYDPDGDKGKSSFILQMKALGYAFIVPPINDLLQFMGVIMSSRELPEPPTCYLIDFPRSLSKTKLQQFWASVETLKSGYCFDTRYKFREAIYDSPNVIVFTNKMPNFDHLSLDRWKIWTINKDNELVYGSGPYINCIAVDPVETDPIAIVTDKHFDVITQSNSMLEDVQLGLEKFKIDEAFRLQIFDHMRKDISENNELTRHDLKIFKDFADLAKIEINLENRE